MSTEVSHMPVFDLSTATFEKGSPDQCLVEDIIKQSLMLINTFAYDENSLASSDQTLGSTWSSNNTSPRSWSPPQQQQLEWPTNYTDNPYYFVPTSIASLIGGSADDSLVASPSKANFLSTSSFPTSPSNVPSLTTPLLSAAELFGFRHNYYPSFDPKDYFCDTVAVANASMVAQIVGKKGAKIKHLVAKYGIRIRTPNMDQEPVFIIKGKRADVYRVKQEILSAAEHFMRIELNKRAKLDAVMNNLGKCESIVSYTFVLIYLLSRINILEAVYSFTLRWFGHWPKWSHCSGSADHL